MLSQENEDLERQLKDGRSGLEDRLKLRLRLEGVIIDAVQALQSVIHVGLYIFPCICMFVSTCTTFVTQNGALWHCTCSLEFSLTIFTLI